jgi:hypothetical protein
MSLIRAVIVLAASASALNGARAAEATNDKATALEQEAVLLAQAMRMEPSTRQALEAKSEGAIKRGRANPAERDCIKKMDLGFVNQIYATAFTKTLTREEIQQATAFFGSPAGKALLQYALDEQFRQGGLSVPQTELSDDTTAEVMEFSATPAGDKLIMKSVHDTPEARQEVAARITPELLKCKQATAP